MNRRVALLSVRIGSIDVAVVTDGRLKMSPEAIAGPNTEWREQMEVHDEKLHLSVNCVVLRVGERVILLDTGTGRDDPALLERLGGDSGYLLDNLRQLGITPEQVDTVVVSHAHGDHVGGATAPSAEQYTPTFTRARYWMGQAEWDHWTKPEVLAERPALERKLPPLRAAQVLELADAEVDVAPGVRLIPAPGHTPGHLCVAITSGSDMAIYTGDLVHHVAQLERPEWCPQVDLLPAMSVASRRRILEQAVRERAVLLTAHLPAPGVAVHSESGWALSGAAV
jgi:glyoxylase-like metal-dependent hydrolase (beta-lactamase superfamily II)